MKRKIALAAALLSGALTFGNAAQALPLNAPVPTNLIVSGGGLDWVWASPCASGGCSTVDLTYQGTLGWRFATAAEELLRPLYEAFIDGSQPQGVKCASQYFDVTYSHCDAGDFSGYGAVTSRPYGSNPNVPYEYYAETILVRGSVTPIPVPAALPMLAVGLAGLAVARRRKKAKAA